MFLDPLPDEVTEIERRLKKRSKFQKLAQPFDLLSAAKRAILSLLYTCLLLKEEKKSEEPPTKRPK